MPPAEAEAAPVDDQVARSDIHDRPHSRTQERGAEEESGAVSVIDRVKPFPRVRPAS